MTARRLAPLLGSFALLASAHCQALTCTSIAGGPNNWGTAATWTSAGNCNRVPANGDDVVIASGSTVTQNANTNNVNSLRVDGTMTVANQLDVVFAATSSITVNGTLTLGNNNTSRTVNVTGDIIVNSGGTVRISPGNTPTITLNVGGDISNASTFDMNNGVGGVGNVGFNIGNGTGAGGGNRTVSGTGTYQFNLITVRLGATTSIVDMQANNVTFPNGFLTLTQGIYKHSSTVNIRPWTAATSISASAGFYLNSTATVDATGFTLTLNGGSLTVDTGTMNIGTAATDNLSLTSNAATDFNMLGGTLNISGGLLTSNTTGNGSYTQSGGTITVARTAAPSQLSFRIGTNTNYTVSGGTLVIQNITSAANDLDIRATTQNVTGGTVQLGNASFPGGAGAEFWMTNTAGGGISIWNLVVVSTNNATGRLFVPLTTESVTIQTNASLIIDAGGTGDITIGLGNSAGSWSNNGTFTSNTVRTVTFRGSGAQSIAGTAATIFNNLTIQKAGSNNNVSIACGTPSPAVGTATVAATLTLTSGNIVTTSTSASGCVSACNDAASANIQVPVIVSAPSTISGGSASSYVQGALRKNFNAAATLNFRAAGSDEFPIGTAWLSGAARYSPIEISAGTTSSAGNVIACATATDDPSMSEAKGGGIDTTKSVNRYWSMTSTTINTLAAPMNAIFKFVTTATSDVDAGATTGNFVVERYDGADWNPATLVAAGASSTQASTIDISATVNEFQIGEPLATFPSVLGVFNAFDTTAAAGAVLGPIQTKQAGVSFSVRVVRIANNAVDTTYNGANIQVQLVDSSNNSLPYVTGCRSSWTTQIGTVNVNFASGVATATFPAAQIPNVYKDVRVRVGGGLGCSTDRFAIRPVSFTIDAIDANWQSAAGTRPLANFAATGGNVHAASESGASMPRPFTLRITPQAGGGQSISNYNQTPSLVSGYPQCCTPSTTPACSTLPASCTLGTLNPVGVWTNTAGVLTNANTHYSEAGVVNVQYEDTSWAAVDANDGSSAATRTIGTTGGVAVRIGRFVPDHFDVSTSNVPSFRTFNALDTACSVPPAGPKRAFTYVGQPFGYATTPQALISAKNAAGNATKNYQSSLWKIGGASPTVAKDCTSDPNVCAFSTTWSPAAGSVAESYAYTLTPASTPNWDNGLAAGATPTVTANNNDTGTGAVTFSAAGLLAFKRSTTTASIPFTASITDTITAQDDAESAVSGNGTITTSTAAAFGGISFDAGNEFRYGRMRILNGSGPTTVDVPMTLRAEYYASTTSGFAVNSADNCSTFATGNFKLFGHQGSITTGNMPDTKVSISGHLTAGVANLKLTKPTGSPSTPGSVKICLDLDLSSGVGDTTCQASSGAANTSYVQGAWTGGTYDKDPVGQMSYGLYGAQPNSYLYFRENY